MEPKLNEFFATYEKANSESDISRIADLYADVFLFAGPQGVQPVKNEDFRKLLPRRKDHIKSLGLLHSKVISLEEVNLDAKYVLAKTVWRTTFQKATGGTTDTEISATYNLEQRESTLKIVVQIDHQDLTTRVRQLGLV
jgi:ketosteroid isomerase-like protein